MKRTIQKAFCLIIILSGISGELLSQHKAINTVKDTEDGPVVINGVSVPSDFPFFTPTINNETAPGYIFLNNWQGSPYIMIFRNDGTPYYYQRVKERSRDFKVQPGNKLSRRGREDIWGFVVMDSNFRDIDTLRCKNGFDTDEHELQLLPNGNALMIGIEDRQMDLSHIPGGKSDATVRGNHVQELDPDHNVVFEWLCWEPFDVVDCGEDLTKGFIDYVHMNSIAVDYDSNIVISSRHLSECTKIDRKTGEIIWRLGGEKNQFEFINDPDQISYQHDIRPVPGMPNHYTIFDNGNLKEPQFSRAVEYYLDIDSMTAEKIWEYRHTPERYTRWMGNTQRMPNGNTFINWADGALPKATEVTPDGEVVYEADFVQSSHCYRAFRFEWNGMKSEPYLIAEPFPDKIRLIFNKFGDQGVLYYKIYSARDDEEMILTDTTVNTWIDLDFEQTGYYNFEVTAIDTSGTESLRSNMERVYHKNVNYGDNLVLNGDFSEGKDHWYLVNSEGASASGSITENGYLITIQSAGTVSWHVQFSQGDIPLVNGTEYILEFDARAESPRIIEVKMEKNGTPWNNYSKTSSVYITGETKHYSYPFKMNDPTDLQARFVVNAGKSDINFSIDNISVREAVTTHSESSEPVDQAELDCFPNPSLNTLYIACSLEQASTITLHVYNISGQQVETVDFGIRGAGQNEFIYNTTGLPNGIYLIQMKTDTGSKYKKIIISD